MSDTDDIQCLATSPQTGKRCVNPSKHTIGGLPHGAELGDAWPVQHYHHGSRMIEGTMNDVVKMLNEEFPWWDVVAIVPDATMKTGMGPYAPPYCRWTVLWRVPIT